MILTKPREQFLAQALGEFDQFTDVVTRSSANAIVLDRIPLDATGIEVNNIR